MSNMVAFHAYRIGQPEWRAVLLAEAIRHTAHVAGPINPWALFRHLQSWLGMAEEECGSEISAILFLMVRSGLYTSNTYDVNAGMVSMAAHTQFGASPALTLCMHGDLDTPTHEDGAA
ncbi:hypothetical protein FPV16_23210 [Methylobacterium sp. W2]|uniref:hypothetical protein n=1 Tax=Methylobacterium sp. W2 TaxID=2598107 RepID=UPI001D0CCE65|nr:hypothetical protein [Methylobacterium sp. W2]MCC0809073.1 hypothetical protein [Methylobacterium sp. W2]